MTVRVQPQQQQQQQEAQHHQQIHKLETGRQLRFVSGGAWYLRDACLA